MINNKLDGEVAAAIDYVSNNVDVTPAGKSTGLMTTDMLATHKRNGSSPLFSGSLTMLDLKDTATNTSDTARMKWFLESAVDHNSLRKAVGPIGVNGDRWAGEMATFSAWHRCDKDAEVLGLCLLAYWEKSDALNELLADLCFQMHMLGVGSHEFSEKLKMIDKEDQKRNVLGLSGWRRCVFFY